MTIDDIGIVKARSLHTDFPVVGRLTQIGDRYFVSVNDFSIGDSGNISKSLSSITQIDSDTVCAYTYQNDMHGEKIFNYDVLRIPETEKILYITWDDIRGAWVYITSWDSTHDENLNINELEHTNKNILYDDDVTSIFERICEDD